MKITALPPKTLIIDLHNTIVEELCEYGPALDAAIEVFAKAVTNSGVPLPVDFKQAMYKDIKAAHTVLQDDWDNRVFDRRNLPYLRTLLGDDFLDSAYEALKQEAITARSKFSEAYIKDNVYPGMIAFIQTAKAQRHRVVIATDANAAGAVPTVTWLGLWDHIDGLYCCPSADMPGTYDGKLRPFKPGLYKPHPQIIGHILLDQAKASYPHLQELSYEDVFAIEKDKDFTLAEMPDWASSRLTIKDGPHKELFDSLLQNTIGIGDDHRDRTLFRNAGIINVWAKYGTKSTPADTGKLKSGKDTIVAVSFWDNAVGLEGEKVNRLTLFNPKNKQYALDAIPVHFTCADSIAEFTTALSSPCTTIRMKALQSGIRSSL